ncbi:porin family protein [Gilvimarinus agarilyticus]|uniref:Outer membrane protein beta-barrel domain-containing protein n=1 Tax=Reichenbachiella agariperforans TaxID=156994 RepID=A0A1M6K4D6_REIAG|nr:outer membrane beta-barrel protein [Reichenbachiella agariperforans]MBU2887965.1 porin family protein [Gilvimarinus agarilyticus]SHJ53755.1 Outer membrane protein beta-barrel domain-containing protein [Reichenbachiella agariperforans]
MKKQLLLLASTLLSINCYSQIIFENGYYINNLDQKIVCQIKNNDWRNNPTKFEYRLSEGDEIKMGIIDSIQEFSIGNNSKYIRRTIDIDRSSDNVIYLSNEKKPIFNEETLFLKVLFEGKSNLYEYVDGNLRRYFYSTEEHSNTQQLVYKQFKNKENKIEENNRYKQQLWNDLKCPSFEMRRFENIDYKKNDLVKIFKAHSLCHNSEMIDLEQKEKRDLFNLTPKVHLNNSSLTLKNSVADYEYTDFGHKTNFGFGVEAEFILPFNKNKWSISIEPTYQYYSAKKSTEATVSRRDVTLIKEIDYSSVEIPISLRYYLFLNENSKLFINASIIEDITSSSSVSSIRNDGSNEYKLDIDTQRNWAFGLGYKYNDKYSLEIRYQTRREVLKEYVFWSSDYRTLAVVIGYTLF